jgi:hypothetical protein
MGTTVRDPPFETRSWTAPQVRAYERTGGRAPQSSEAFPSAVDGAVQVGGELGAHESAHLLFDGTDKGQGA